MPFSKCTFSIVHFMHHTLQYHIAMTPENYFLNGRPEISIYLTIAYFKCLYTTNCVCKHV